MQTSEGDRDEASEGAGVGVAHPGALASVTRTPASILHVL